MPVKGKQYTAVIISCACMFFCIIDSKVVLSGAKEGIEICINSVIPSLFPLFVISGYLCSRLNDISVLPLKRLGRACGIPEGCESVLLLGFLSGYPVGAQSVSQLYEDRKISKDTAQRMLAFCSNAGPSFIFGILSGLFRNPIIPWVLWGIHIISALFVAISLPGKCFKNAESAKSNPLSLPQSLERAVRSVAAACGWIILFRVISEILTKRPLATNTTILTAILTGILELTNGCLRLSDVALPEYRFLISSGLLAFGGVCVYMQTRSAVGNLSCVTYFFGKLMQCSASLVISALLLPVLFQTDCKPWMLLTLVLSASAVYCVSLLFCKKTVAFFHSMMYSKHEEKRNRGYRHAFQKKNREIMRILRIRSNAG